MLFSTKNSTPYLPDRNSADGRAYRTLRNKLGVAYLVFRSLSIGGIHPKHVTPRYSPWAMPAVTARHGVGRPPGTAVKACRQFEPVPTLAERQKFPPPMVVRGPGGLTLAKMRAAWEMFKRASEEDDGPTPTMVEWQRYAGAVTRFGSQRKAAAALGISLGKLQRELRKAQ